MIRESLKGQMVERLKELYSALDDLVRQTRKGYEAPTLEICSDRLSFNVHEIHPLGLKLTITAEIPYEPMLKYEYSRRREEDGQREPIEEGFIYFSEDAQGSSVVMTFKNEPLAPNLLAEKLMQPFPQFS